jgi:Tol biopolymer transport system component
MNKINIQTIIIISISFLFGIFGCGTKPKLDTIFYFDLSPTQDKILIFGNYGKERWGLFVNDLSKGECRLLRQIDYCTSSPMWSPNGKYIVYDTPNGLCRITMDGRVSQVTNIAETKAIWDSFPKWSPQDDKIAFVRCFEERKEKIKEYIPRQGYTDLWMIDLKSQEEVCLIENFWWHWEWSVDGKNIFFLRVFRENPQNMDLWSINVNTKEQKRLTQNFKIWHFNISPDKNRILFLSSKEPRGLGIMNIDGTELKYLSKDDIIFANWSPDGEKIAFLRRTNRGNELCIIDLSNPKEKKRLAFGDIHTFKWHKSGTQITFLKGYNTLWSINSDGDIQRQIFPIH